MKNLPCHLVMIMKVNLQHAERKMGIRMVFAHVIWFTLSNLYVLKVLCNLLSC